MPSFTKVASIAPLLLAFIGCANAAPAAKPRHGAVVAEDARCSDIGTSMLRAGGTAADALVATVFCTGTLNMYHSGIGGGGFMLVRAPNGTYEFIDFRESAPAAAFTDMYNNDTDLSIYGGLASGIPGEVRGMQHLHDNYGQLPWSTVIAPAVNLARNGFTVSADLVKYMAGGQSPSETIYGNFLSEDPNWAIDFAPNGTLVGLNDTMTRKRYADTLETIAQKGADAFYTGAIANTTITALTRQNGTMTLEDLKNYTVAIRKPANTTYRDFKLTSCSAPSSGEVALSIMKYVETYQDFGDPAAINISTHRLDEAMRFAYAERANLGDPAFNSSIQSYQENMVSPAVASEVDSKITDYSHNVSYYNPQGLQSLNDSGTSYIAAADEDGMAISLTTTVNLLFGSQLLVPETGIIMNNEMNDFSIPGSSNAFGYIPSEANYIKPGKRPLSSISPTIVEHLSNSSLYYITGSAGGSRIITATVQSLWHVLDQGMTPQEAVTAPRLHDQLTPNACSLEYSYDNSTAAFLKERGHNVTYIAPGQSEAHAIRVSGCDVQTFETGADPRQKNSGGSVV